MIVEDFLAPLEDWGPYGSIGRRLVLRPGANLGAAMIASGLAESISVWAAAADTGGTTQVETGCAMSAPSALDTAYVLRSRIRTIGTAGGRR